MAKYLYAEYNTYVSSRYETTNMHWQLYCHAMFAPTKSRWNLDSWVRRTSLQDSVNHNCN